MYGIPNTIVKEKNVTKRHKTFIWLTKDRNRYKTAQKLHRYGVPNAIVRENNDTYKTAPKLVKVLRSKYNSERIGYNKNTSTKIIYVIPNTIPLVMGNDSIKIPYGIKNTVV